MISVVALLLVVVGQAQASPYIRAAYWDSNYGTAWAGDGIAVRDALEAAGYEVLDAAALRDWMDARIADRKLSVVVMCRDAVPDTVAETQDADCTIRRYLDAGGKVVWYSDIPFYYVTTAGGANTTWGTGGSTNILGFNAAGGAWDVGGTVTITDEGVKWGLTDAWTSTRPAAPAPIENFTILASDANGNAPGYVAHFLPGDTFRGFVRIEDHTGAPVNIDNLIAVAEYAESINTATGPQPESGAMDIPRDVVLSWSAGYSAVTHDVYFGASFDDVNAATRSNPRGVLLSQGQSDTTFDPPGILDFDTTYYWRVDEVNGAPDNTIFKGDVWSFTAEPFAYAIANITATSNATSEAAAGPQNTVNGSGLNADDQHSIISNDMWLGLPVGDEPVWIQWDFDGVYKLHEMMVWNYNVQFELLLGFGVKDVTVEYSENGTDWTALGDVTLNQATAKATYVANTTVDFQGVAAKSVRMTVNGGFGVMSQYGLSEVRFMYIPAQAREPQPADGATDVSVDSALTWRAGRDAASHEVYFGADAEALALAGTVSVNTYAPGELNLGTTYYWQINEVQDIESWQGPVWSFATQEYLVVDDFESYNDDIDAGTTIFDTWLDGWVNETGSTVGYLNAPFAEKTTVHSGRQSMPLAYDNTSVAVSEADLELSANWSLYGIQSLSLYFYGAAGNTGQLYVKINGTKVAYDGPAINLARPSWQLWSIDLSKAGNVSNVRSLTIGVEGSGAKGILLIDDIRLYPEVLSYISPDVTGAGDTVQGVPNDADWPAAETPNLAIDDNVNTKFLHFKGETQPTGIRVTPLAGATVVTGLTLTTANDAPERDPVKFELSGSNGTIDGPYTLIASGDVVDFAGATAWPRFTKNATPIEFANTVAYKHYQILFPAVRTPASANSMQIAEIELLGAAQ
jgi:hypothetical protein